jgi:hypothetical protein
MLDPAMSSRYGAISTGVTSNAPSDDELGGYTIITAAVWLLISLRESSPVAKPYNFAY